MSEEKYPHIFIPDICQTEMYQTPHSGRIPFKIPSRDRIPHAEIIKNRFNTAWAQNDENNSERSAISVFDDRSGCYLDVRGAEGADLIYQSLEHLSFGIRLCNIQEEQTQYGIQTKATIFIPKEKRGYFLKKIHTYATENTPTGKPKNQKMVESIEDIKLSIIESFWQDNKELIPTENREWCEIWLSTDNSEAIIQFYTLCKILHLMFKEEHLLFPERTVCIVYVSGEDINKLIINCPILAEIRLAKETASFWMDLKNIDQTEWLKNLKQRLRVNPNPIVSVCILDSGINSGHELINPVLAEKDIYVWNKEWGTHDHDGHGTLMAGTSIYNDLEEVLQSQNEVQIYHKIESVKIIPPKGENPKHLWGHITNQSINLAAIGSPRVRRVICLAVCSNENRDRGRPSSWSGEVDNITSGSLDDEKKLFIVAAGNAENEQNDYFRYCYPDSNLSDSIHDPGQSWNALTIGAYTQKVSIKDRDYVDFTPVTDVGGLSPFSTTSLTWDSKWPNKPDILMEGGNGAIDASGSFTTCDDLSILSTNHEPSKRQFGIHRQTSCATAKAAWFAAQIWSRYPEAWPETIRALMVHSADWTDKMKQQFLKDESKSAYAKLLRVCGYGVPSLNKALECTNNALTLVAQKTLQPFDKVDGAYKTNDMHFYELPWPKQELERIGAVEIVLRVTLSYFIEPGPGEIGWKDRYRYASHGLRFDMNKPTEDKTTFKKRINNLAREDGESDYSCSDKWIIGPNNRSRGSIHSDIWIGSAADLASSNLIGVFPVIGWWRERKNLQKWNKRARYSLIVSIYTPPIDIDIYTPVAIQVKTAIPITI